MRHVPQLLYSLLRANGVYIYNIMIYVYIYIHPPIMWLLQVSGDNQTHPDWTSGIGQVCRVSSYMMSIYIIYVHTYIYNHYVIYIYTVSIWLNSHDFPMALVSVRTTPLSLAVAQRQAPRARDTAKIQLKHLSNKYPRIYQQCLLIDVDRVYSVDSVIMFINRCQIVFIPAALAKFVAHKC